ncbi:glutamyl-tRNA(Gln) amidotransferase subunit C, chloroplastic/mitochondrial [Ananas comosus]|uniref:Glutamyl-tRNA(Gln) amidotransferase subunit C, chloroplastic/mitochondrial n=1 Tax=Ananas comosus TaxID=4615 RepID=A0A6P5F6R9_ANACO|nr:glutamyl-tRNA(Gln) amidotransferase subunit C, chloroplastic/mitochondrial [Ananas comosus]
MVSYAGVGSLLPRLGWMRMRRPPNPNPRSRWPTRTTTTTTRRRSRSFSSSSPLRAALDSPDVSLLADAARISLSPNEVREFEPKIMQVIDWFGQLQAVDLESIEPSLRANTEVDARTREDAPEAFDNREAIIAAVPSYEDPYIKVPRVLNKE